jgi:membrane protease YdiL (CAAX protease family)
VTESGGETSKLWHGRSVLIVLIVAALGVTVGVEGVGAIGAFLIAIVVALVARKKGSFRDMGFRAPESWPKLLGRSALYGLVIQVLFLAIVEPLLGRLMGSPVDLSVFDGVRGNFVSFLILLGVGWGIGGFLEEFTFRGFVVGRVRWLLGSGTAATWFAVLVAAIPFGLAHAYQGVSGMITTGLTGFILGAIYVLHRCNLWYAIFTHGFINTVGILAIYLDVDHDVGHLLFG